MLQCSSGRKPVSVLPDELEPFQVVFRPAGLELDDAPQRFYFERVSPTVGCYGNTPAIGMPVPLVGTALADEIKTVTLEGGNKFARGERSEATVIDRHGPLNSNSNTRLIL